MQLKLVPDDPGRNQPGRPTCKSTGAANLRSACAAHALAKLSSNVLSAAAYADG